VRGTIRKCAVLTGCNHCVAAQIEATKIKHLSRCSAMVRNHELCESSCREIAKFLRSRAPGSGKDTPDHLDQVRLDPGTRPLT
jgi:hypothetical protein